MEIQNKKILLQQLDEGKLNSLKLASGTLIFPKDFVYLNLGNQPEQCQYAGVVECRNGHKYHVPHFIFCYDGEKKITNDLVDEVFAACTTLFPNLKALQKKDISLSSYPPKAPYKRKIWEAKFKEWEAAPELGYFPVDHEKDLQLILASYPGYRPPYNCIII